MLEVNCDDRDLLPQRMNPTDAGLDLRAAKDYIIYQGQRVLVGTGVKIKIPVGYVGLLFPRSSLSKKGLHLANSVGVIDTDYRGEIMASIYFNNDFLSIGYQTIDKYERIVQLVLVPVLICNISEYTGLEENWVDTVRGTGGFGSTGEK